MAPRLLLGNAALDADLASRLTLTFLLLPHVPRLRELTTATPPLLCWASLVAYAEPRSVSEVRAEVRCGSEGVAALLAVLEGSAAEIEAERYEAEQEAQRAAMATEDLLVETRSAGRTEGRAEGRADGVRDFLRSLGIASAADYRARCGNDAPPDVMRVLREMMP